MRGRNNWRRSKQVSNYNKHPPIEKRGAMNAEAENE